MTAADHLKMATAAHTRYRRASGAVNSQGVVTSQPDLAQCRAEIQTALDHRQQAEQLDPDISERDVSHVPLLQFYRDYLQRAEARGV